MPAFVEEEDEDHELRLGLKDELVAAIKVFGLLQKQEHRKRCSAFFSWVIRTHRAKLMQAVTKQWEEAKKEFTTTHKLLLTQRRNSAVHQLASVLACRSIVRKTRAEAFWQWQGRVL